MRKLMLVAALLCLATAAHAKKLTGSYINKYLTLSEQVNTEMAELRADIILAYGELKAETAGATKRKKKKKTEAAQPVSTGGKEISYFETPAGKEMLAKRAELRESLPGELEERVTDLRERIARLREIAPPPELRRARWWIVQYSRSMDAVLDLLKTATYKRRVDDALLDRKMGEAKNYATLADREMGRYLDAKPVATTG